MRTVFGLFSNYNDAVKAVDELYRQGYNKDQIQVLTERGVAKTITDNMPAVDQGDNLLGMLAGRQPIQVSGVGSVVAVGPLTSIFAQSAAEPAPMRGGLVGAFKEMGMPDDVAAIFTDGINQSGVVLAVRAEDDRAATAANSMRRFNGKEVNSYS